MPSFQLLCSPTLKQIDFHVYLLAFPFIFSYNMINFKKSQGYLTLSLEMLL